ncbi:hypothetical protein EDD36DRAFT_487828 [Exophiala viscosa]|uniref:Zn(2)-C6 fungal-type domain-containing protein n=1 Tax=Exophiala viscosa TaxID=2486360 RepID=A0AAN6ID77_9EURO|nr:hypothetical protein EDD36DRAFT_487828 [Exophiala viscosa]
MTDNKRKRSTRACETCRARKVRCDMQMFGSPCSNCRYQQIPCNPAENTRIKKYPKDHCRRCNTELFHHSEHQHESETSSPTASWSPADGQRNHGSLSEHEQTKLPACSTYHDRQPSTGIDNDTTLTFLKRPHLPEDDMVHLLRRGAFRVPERKLVLELLTSYCNYIHPQLPVLDLQPLLNAVVGKNGPKVSLLLFQAVMYAGMAHLDEEVLRLYGCRARNEAQDRMFNRVKLLYEFDVEADLLTVAQACLLMSISHQCSKTSTIWLAQGHLLAQRLGFENAAAYSLMKVERSNSGKRLWWSIFVRDNTLRLELGTPQRLQDTPYDVPFLSLDCFDLSPFPTHVQDDLSGATVVDSPKMHRLMMQLAIRRTELVCHLSQISAISSKLPVLAKVFQGVSIYFEQALRRWDSELEPELRFNPGAPSPVLDYHRGLLSLLFLSTSNTLLQSRLQPASSDVVDLGVRSSIERDTGKGLKIVQELYSSGSWLPPTLGMGLVYNAINLYVGLAEWRKTRRSCPLHLDEAVVCLRSLGKSQHGRTAIGVALYHLESRIKRLGVEPRNAGPEDAKLLEKLGRKDDVNPFVTAKGSHTEHLNSPNMTLDSADDQLEAMSAGSSIDELFDWAMEPQDTQPHSLWHAESIACN